MYASPETIVTGGTAENRVLSPEASDIVGKLKQHYIAQGKKGAAHSYLRHLRSFFSWTEAQGHSIRSLPPEAVELFLLALKASGQKDTTLFVTRSQLRTALKDAYELFSLEVGHLEYVTGRPAEIKQAAKDKEKAKKKAVKDKNLQAQQAAIKAAQEVLGVRTAKATRLPMPEPMPSYSPPPPPPQESGWESVIDIIPEEQPMSEQASTPVAAAPAPAAPAPQIIVVPSVPGGSTGNKATVANSVRQNASSQPVRGVVINNHTFTGAFVKISYIADGSNPFTPPGTETYVTTLPASQLAPHGDLGAFLQSYIIPSMRLSPTTSQVQFVFHELNDRRQPTGRRDELVVGIPLGQLGSTSMGTQPAPSMPGIGFGGLPLAPQSQQSSGMSDATSFLLKKLDEEAAEAKKRAEEYQTQLREAKDSQTTFMLMQAFQKEQDLRKELEERRERESARALAPPPVVTSPPPMNLMPPMPLFAPESPKAPDTSAADMVRALAEQQSKMMEVMMAGIAANRPPPPPAQKDTSEWLVPFMGQMQQQAQAQAAAQQQMMLTIMQNQQAQQQAAMAAQQQAAQQMMQLMMSKESTTEKILMAQLQEAKAVASAPKGDELESFADKLQKMKMVSDMLGGGGGGSLLTDVLANMDTIGAGVAKVVDAAKGNAGALAAAPTQQVQVEQRQLMGAPNTTQQVEMPPPSEGVLAAHKALSEMVEKREEEGTAQAFIEFLKQMITAQEPYASMGRRLMTAFQQAEDEGELYTLAKNLWIVVGEKPSRPQAKWAARILAEFYSDLHQSIFGEARMLPEDEEMGDDEAGTDSDESAA